MCKRPGRHGGTVFPAMAETSKSGHGGRRQLYSNTQMYLSIHLASSVGIVMLKLVEILGCAKIHNETSHGLGA